MLELEFAELTDPGSVREHNEDYAGHYAPKDEQSARSHGWLFVLADGVGGQDRGEVASSMAVETMLEGFRKAPASESHSTLLPRLIQSANHKVLETGLATGPSGSNMASTVVACALRFDRAIISHVGDSRCYLARQGFTVSLTRDHTVSNEQFRMGLISAREAAAAETSHLLSRALGNNMFVSVETSEHQLLPGDILVLCSDGLHHSVTCEDISEAINSHADLRAVAQKLVQIAKERDGSDNISVQLIRIRGVERVGMYRGRHYKIH
jgi:protein phosphatase